MTSKINVIDLFAGPGGLGEGFSAFKKSVDSHPFHIRMSVEKEASAHKTLTLRALYRSLTTKCDRALYQGYVTGRVEKQDLINKLPDAWDQANAETLSAPRALGEDNDLIHRRLQQLKREHAGEPWLVIGGPPCQAYSLAGRSRNKGILDYQPENDGRHFLYQEYLEVLSIIQPDVFVMENVKGILTSRVGGEKIFPTILKDLANPKAATGKSGRRIGKSYRIYSFVCTPEDGDLFSAKYMNDSDYIIRAERYGVPQARHRVILLGVSDELDQVPEILEPSSSVKIEQVLSGLPPLRSRLSKQEDSPSLWQNAVKRQASRMRHELAANGLNAVIDVMDKAISTLYCSAPSRSANYKSAEGIGRRLPDDLREWLIQDRPDEITNHETRSHIEADLGRYLFCSSWAEAFLKEDNQIPKASQFPHCLAPKHANWLSGNFADRFRVQAKGRPATTITSHISKDGHYFIHYDPRQCRSLTVREASRIQTFPDNYFFEGNRTQQYVQVGNAVPPFLAHQLAGIVYKIIVGK